MTRKTKISKLKKTIKETERKINEVKECIKGCADRYQKLLMSDPYPCVLYPDSPYNIIQVHKLSFEHELEYLEYDLQKFKRDLEEL